MLDRALRDLRRGKINHVLVREAAGLVIYRRRARS
jgi:hypothetical protein